MGNIIDHSDNVLADGFVYAVEFALLSVGNLWVLDVRLVHEIMADGDGAVFEIVGVGEDPQIPCDRLLDADVHSERVLDLFYVVKYTGGSTSKQEQMGGIGVNFG